MHFNLKRRENGSFVYVLNVLSFKQGSFKVHCWNNYSKWYQLATTDSSGTLQMHCANHMRIATFGKELTFGMERNWKYYTLLLHCQNNLKLQLYHEPDLPLVFSGISFLTSRHQFNFFWRSSEFWVAWSIRDFWRSFWKGGQKWHILKISMVYLCIVLKCWIIPLLYLTRSSDISSLIFTAFSMLLKYKAWGMICDPAILYEETYKRTTLVIHGLFYLTKCVLNALSNAGM